MEVSGVCRDGVTTGWAQQASDGSKQCCTKRTRLLGSARISALIGARASARAHWILSNACSELLVGVAIKAGVNAFALVQSGDRVVSGDGLRLRRSRKVGSRTGCRGASGD